MRNKDDNKYWVRILMTYSYNGHEDTDNYSSVRSRKLTFCTWGNLFPVWKKTTDCSHCIYCTYCTNCIHCTAVQL